MSLEYYQEQLYRALLERDDNRKEYYSQKIEQLQLRNEAIEELQHLGDYIKHLNQILDGTSTLAFAENSRIINLAIQAGVKGYNLQLLLQKLEARDQFQHLGDPTILLNQILNGTSTLTFAEKSRIITLAIQADVKGYNLQALLQKIAVPPPKPPQCDLEFWRNLAMQSQGFRVFFVSLVLYCIRLWAREDTRELWTISGLFGFIVLEFTFLLLLFVSFFQCCCFSPPSVDPVPGDDPPVTQQHVQPGLTPPSSSTTQSLSTLSASPMSQESHTNPPSLSPLTNPNPPSDLENQPTETSSLLPQSHPPSSPSPSPAQSYTCVII